MNALARIDSKVWGILPSFLDGMKSAVAGKDFEQRAPRAAAVETPVGALNYGSISQDGVATIDVKGVLYNPDGYIDDIIEYYFGGTSIPNLIRDIDAVANNSAITAVVFNFHSPGGEVFGINEAADKIAALSAKKPTTAYCYGYCCSAAYFLAAKCQTIVTDAQAMIGSIGVVCTWYDLTGFYEQMGVAYEEVTSENAPYKRLDIRNDADRAVFMDEINGIEAVFLKSVAKGRGVPLDTVKSDFGKGAVMAGYLAVKAGMADRTGSLDEVVKELSRKRNKTASATADAEGDIEMGFKEEFKKFAAMVGFNVEEVALAIEQEAPEAEGEEVIEAAPEAAASAVPATEPTAETRLAELEAQIAEDKKAKITTDANAFADSEIVAGRMLPAEKTLFTSLYVHAASDDSASPLETGSRVESFKALQAARKPHGLTKEAVSGDDNEIFVLGLGETQKTKMQREAEAQVDNYVATVTPQSKQAKLEAVK